MTKESSNEPLDRRLLNFDANYSPQNPINQQAAEQRRWEYDLRKGFYVDEDGCLMADRFGQPLG